MSSAEDISLLGGLRSNFSQMSIFIFMKMSKRSIPDMVFPPWKHQTLGSVLNFHSWRHPPLLFPFSTESLSELDNSSPRDRTPVQQSSSFSYSPSSSLIPPLISSDCCQCSDVRDPLHHQCPPCLPRVLAHFLHHGGPGRDHHNHRRRCCHLCYINVIANQHHNIQFFGGKFYKCVDEEGVRLTVDIVNDRWNSQISTSITKNVISRFECAAKNYTWVNSKITFDHVGHAYLALFQV